LAKPVPIIDSEGRIVWYFRDERELDIFRARLSRDKQSILYNAASVSGTPADNAELMRVSLDGSEVTGIPVPLLAHDFVEFEDGSVGAIVTEYRTVNDEEIRGNQIVEVSADGTVFGEPIRLDNGNTLINWSAAGQLNLVTPEGVSICQIELQPGFGFAFNTLETTLYLSITIRVPSWNFTCSRTTRYIWLRLRKMK
jgi:hypothetical protein